MKTKRRLKGFTLIELMVVVGIIAILAAIAIPAYQNYLVRAQVSEGIALMDGAKTAVTEFYAANGRYPNSNQSAGLPSATSIASKYVGGVDAGSMSQGKIIVGFYNQANPAIKNTFLSLSAINNGGSISWVCGSKIGYPMVPPQYLPTSCRN